MIEEICKDGRTLTFIKWQDKWGHYRAGINWKTGDDYLFICEKPTPKQCLECILENKEEWENE